MPVRTREGERGGTADELVCRYNQEQFIRWSHLCALLLIKTRKRKRSRTVWIFFKEEVL